MKKAQEIDKEPKATNQALEPNQENKKAQGIDKKPKATSQALEPKLGK